MNLLIGLIILSFFYPQARAILLIIALGIWLFGK
jgi:hypothetical protein